MRLNGKKYYIPNDRIKTLFNKALVCKKRKPQNSVDMALLNSEILLIPS